MKMQKNVGKMCKTVEKSGVQVEKRWNAELEERWDRGGEKARPRQR